ncbi:hypothetical protein ABPG75_010525 [Micractinium tetrahymenae]
MDLKAQEPLRLLGVRTDDGQRVQLRAQGPAAAQADGLTTGMRVELAGLWMHPEATPGLPKPQPYFMAGSIKASGGAAGAAPQPTVTRQQGSGAVAAAAGGGVKAIVIPIAGVASPGVACPGTTLPLTTVAAVKRAVFEESNPRGVTVGSTLNKCSYGITKLTSSSSFVAPLLNLPCNSTNNGVNWTFSKCDFDDFNGYAEAADEALRQRGVNLDAYKHRVYLLPPSQCGFVGLGYIGCDGSFDCRVWIGADVWATPAAIVHEIGHNLFLAHAGAVTSAGVFDDYADISGTMGYCCSDRCPNTPHAWQLGWVTMQQIDGTTIKPGQTLTFSVSSQAVSRQAGLRITLGNSSDPLFVGYRTKAGGDAAAPVDIAGLLSSITPGRLHLYTAAIANTFDPQPTDWKGSLGTLGSSWAHPTAGIVVRLKSINRTAAVVTLCRKAGPETPASCRAGLDNDCNGLAGDKDPACLKLRLLGRVRRRP